MDKYARSLIKSIEFDPHIPAADKEYGKSIITITSHDQENKITSFLFFVNCERWHPLTSTVFRIHHREWVRNENNYFQHHMGDPHLSEIHFSLYLVSLFSQDLGGWGFAKPRKFRCADCQTEHFNINCPNCQHNWATGYKCWCYFPTTSGGLIKCNDCLDEDFMGQLLLKV